MSVFVLDDDPFILKGITRALPDVEVVTAEAWSTLVSPVLRAGAGSVLVCDLDMPGIRGLDFCRTVRRHAPHIRIVVFSAGALGSLPAEVVDAAVPKGAGIGVLALKIHEQIQVGEAAAPKPPPVRRAPRSGGHRRPDGPKSRSNPRPQGPSAR